VKYAVRLVNRLSNSFPSVCGVRQGCNLSPLLFNLFINDISECFDPTKCDPAVLTSKSLNCLSWADDLALISSSKQGLQHCIDCLENYCKKWKLSVNVSKTKVVVFGKGSSKNNKDQFHIYGKNIEITDSYTYLGIPFTFSGKFKTARKYLKTKAMRALFKLKALLFSNKDISINLGKNLFDKFVKPIFMYCSEITCFDRFSKSIRIIVSHTNNICESSSKVFSTLLKKLDIQDNFPATIRKTTSSALNSTYVVCLERNTDKETLLPHANNQILQENGFQIINLDPNQQIPEFDVIDMRFQKFLLGIHAKA